MRRFLYSIVAVTTIIGVAACTETDYATHIKPINLKIGFSDAGCSSVLLDVEEPTVSFAISKNYPISKINCELTPMTQKELDDALIEYEVDDAYQMLPDQYYELTSEVTIPDAGSDASGSITFLDITNINPDIPYAVGINLTSSTSNVSVNPEKAAIILVLKVPGKGSKGNPLEITTLDEFLNLHNTIDAYFDGIAVANRTPMYIYLETDVDLTGVDWAPLDQSGVYPLNFEGNNHVISNMTCKGPGFFGYFWGTCENLTFKDASVEVLYENGQEDKAGIVAGSCGLVGWGRDHSGYMYNVHANGVVNHTCNPSWVGWTGQAGGLVGELVYSDSKMEKCSADVTVTSNWVAGGLVGQLNNCEGIDQCFAAGDVTVSAVLPSTPSSSISSGWMDPSIDNYFNVKLGYDGGLVGVADYASITNCYATGNVYNTDRDRGMAGGLLGAHRVGVVISKCYASGAVDGTVDAGGIMAGSTFYHTGSCTLEKCIAANESISAYFAASSIGRICGYIGANTDGGGSNKGGQCYATDIPMTLGGAPYTAQYFEYQSWYDGETTSDVNSTAQNLGWDSSVWDFTGSLPVLAWEK